MPRVPRAPAVAALAVFLIAADASPAPLPTPAIVSGTPQTVHAYVAPATSQYVAEFPKPLVVRITGKYDHVRFSCPALHCGLHVADEANTPGTRVNARSYDAVVKNGTASLQIGLATDLPSAVSMVYAQAVDSDGTLGPKSAPFVLSSQ